MGNRIINRIAEYIDNQELTIASFERKCGISNGYLSKMKDRQGGFGEDMIIKVLENCRDINPLWLILGEGDMLKTIESKVEAYHSQVAIGKNINQQKDVVESSTADVEMLKAKIASLERELQQKDETIRAKDETLQLYKQLLGKN